MHATNTTISFQSDSDNLRTREHSQQWHDVDNGKTPKSNCLNLKPQTYWPIAFEHCCCQIDMTVPQL